MLLRLFKGTSPAVIILITITLAAVWLSALLTGETEPVTSSTTGPMPLYGILTGFVGENHFLGVILSLSIVSVMSFLLVNFNTNEFFITERTFLPALIYILLSGLIPSQQILNPAIPASLLLLLAIIRIMDGYRKPGVAYNFFDAGLMISTGSLFYADLIWFGLLVIIGIAIMRPVHLGEISIAILGLLTPYMLTFGYFYSFGKDTGALLSLVKDNLFVHSAGYDFSTLTIVILILTGMILMVSLAFLVRVINSKKIKSRKTFSILIWTLLISVVVYIFLPSASVEIVWIMIIPSSYFLAHYFVFDRMRMVPEILFSLLFIFILIIQIRNLG